MGKPVLITVTGHPCTGKTTLAEKIAQKFRLPLVTKDGIKESLFDTLGIGDREWSKRLGFASWGLLYYFLDNTLKAGFSVIAEGNFRPQNDDRKFRYLEEKYAFACLQIYCHCSDDINIQRYRDRAELGIRHPGHLDSIMDRELEESLSKGSYGPLDIHGDVVHVDTTDFSKIDYKALYKRIQSILKNKAKV